MTYLLKRCPWCHSHELDTELTVYTVRIRCQACDCAGPVTTRDVATAVELWNGEYIHQNPAAVLVGYEQPNRNSTKEIDL